jgi:hypothetical protein
VRFDPNPTNDATDLTDEPWAALAPLVITPSSNFKGGQKICAMHISGSIRTPWQAGLEPAPASAVRRGGQNSRLRIAMPENASLLKRSVRP